MLPLRHGELGDERKVRDMRAYINCIYRSHAANDIYQGEIGCMVLVPFALQFMRITSQQLVFDRRASLLSLAQQYISYLDVIRVSVLCE